MACPLPLQNTAPPREGRAKRVSTRPPVVACSVVAFLPFSLPRTSCPFTHPLPPPPCAQICGCCPCPLSHHGRTRVQNFFPADLPPPLITINNVISREIKRVLSRKSVSSIGSTLSFPVARPSSDSFSSLLSMVGRPRDTWLAGCCRSSRGAASENPEKKGRKSRWAERRGKAERIASAPKWPACVSLLSSRHGAIC